MGEEITKSEFLPREFAEFRIRIEQETGYLAECFALNRFSHHESMAGFEMEAWLVDEQGMPTPENESFLKNLGNSLVVPELSRFNIELNGSPTSLQGRVFSRLEDELKHTWMACRENAQAMHMEVVAIGILPSIEVEMLNADNMSSMTRYAALNERVLKLRKGQPFEIDIRGREGYHSSHPDLMLEAATTSFQIHFQVAPIAAVRAYNASLACSAPLVALAANAPYLFGHDLWHETRIPLFEQAVAVGDPGYRRVTFGHDYVSGSLLSIFQENLRHYPVLMPVLFPDPMERFSHIRFHNGTIWRWNRPLIGFDHDGVPHIRIEHRSVAAGPTVTDSIANAAFYFGVVLHLMNRDQPIEEELEFEQARANFYRAARDGLTTQLHWPDVGLVECRHLILEILLPMARAGLRAKHIPDTEIDHYLDIIMARVETGRNGAAWQRQWVERNGRDACGLTRAYLHNQNLGLPVHEWPVAQPSFR